MPTAAPTRVESPEASAPSAPAHTRGLVVAAWLMLLLAPVGLLAGVGLAQLVTVGPHASTVARLTIDMLGLAAMTAPQLVGAALAVAALRRAQSRAAWVALTANLIVMGLPFFVSAGGGNLVNVTSMGVVSALAVRLTRAA